MKKIYALVTILAASFAANAQTLLNTNGSLETWPTATVEPAGWYLTSKLTAGEVERGDTNSQDGNYHLIVKGHTASTGNNTPTLQDIVVLPNETYTVSYYYKSDAGANYKHWIQFRDGANPSQNISVTGNPAQPSANLPVASTWTLETVTFTTPANTAALRVGFRNYQGASVYIDNVKVYQGTLSTKENNIEGLNIFPNPANDVLNITSNSAADKNVQLFDLTGKKVLDVTTVSQVNVSTLKAGIYVAKINEAGKTATRKVIIK